MSLTIPEADGTDDLPAAPTLLLPITVQGGTTVTVPQGSRSELVQSVRLLMTTRPGERLAQPEYGLPDLTFSHTIDPQDIRASIEEQEPRVDLDVTVKQAGARADITVIVRPEEA